MGEHPRHLREVFAYRRRGMTAPGLQIHLVILQNGVLGSQPKPAESGQDVREDPGLLVRHTLRPFDMRLLLCAFWIAGVAGMLHTTDPSVEAAHRAQEAETKERQVVNTVCGRCHPVERALDMRRTRSQWEETMTTMITSRGAQISDEDFETILSYLAKEYGRVDVNRAPAADLAEVLHIPGAMAAAIVAYRREHGRFEDFDALMKVPGIDREKLETKRDAITFS